MMTILGRRNVAYSFESGTRARIDFFLKQNLPSLSYASSMTIFFSSSSSSHHHNQEAERQELFVLGSGSIGLFLSAAIRSSRHSTHHPLCLLLRNHHARNIRTLPPSSSKQGTSNSSYIDIMLEQKRQKQNDGDDSSHPPIIQRKVVHVPVRLIAAGDDGGDLPKKKKEIKIQTLVLTTKAFQAAPALQSLVASKGFELAPTARIVVLCNGALAVLQKLKQVFFSSFPNWKIELASITHGAYQKKMGTTTPYHVVHAGVGKIFLVSQASPSSSSLSSSLDDNDHNDPLSPRVLEQAGLHPHVVATPHEMERILWYKLAANCVCNPLTAIHQCTNGELYTRVPNFEQDVMPQIIEEVCWVMNKMSMPSSDSTATTNASTEEVQAFVEQVIHDNWYNQSSMQQDVLYQRPTEIDYLNGFIVELGNQHGMDTPMNRQLQQQILELQKQYLNS